MVNKDERMPCCPPEKAFGCCRVESIVSVDERGQMVLPKETRERANIRAGEKLALISWENEGKISGMFLMKTEGLAEMIKGMLGPMAKEILK